MTSLAEFQKLNPSYQILPLSDPKFSDFGVVYDQYDIQPIEAVMDNVQLPASGSTYIRKDPNLEKLDVVKQMGMDIFAGMPIEAGATIGQSTTFSAIEFHQSSELNVMLDDVIMVLGHRQDLERNGNFNPNDEGTMFYVPAGSVIEIYNDTLHYAPIEVTEKGFKVIVMLVDGTNKEFPTGVTADNPRVVKQGKFQIVHESRKDKIAQGAVVGVVGPLIKMRPLTN